MDDSNEGNHTNNGDSLREFIAEECAEQLRNNQNGTGSEDSRGVDTERLNQFFERALSESKRMSREVSKCHTQLNDLHSELGAEKFATWTEDHASQVLSSEEFHLWSEQEKETKQQLEQLKLQCSQAEDTDSGDDVSH